MTLSISDRSPTQAEFESLFVNNVDLDQLRAGLNRFNPIHTMGMADMEIRHSAILGWLLDPQETHGLRDGFLRAFLGAALSGYDGSSRPTALEVSQSDLSAAEVRREWRHIDLLVICPRQRWVFVIENKFNSTQREGQLRGYRELASETFAGSQIRGVFLTLNEEEPKDSSFVTVRYEDICDLLPRFIEGRAHPLSSEVETFMRHYLNTLLEATNLSEHQRKLEQLAKELYRDHRKVLDFIVEHGTATDLAVATEAAFGAEMNRGDIAEIADRRFVFGGLGKRDVSFLPQSWYDALGGNGTDWDGCGGWWMGFPVVTWFRLLPSGDKGGGRIKLSAEVGPLRDHDMRADLIGRIRTAAKTNALRGISFRSDAAERGRMYSNFFTKNFFPVDDIQDAEKLAEAMRKALVKFQPEFDAVGDVLTEFVEVHGAGKR